MYINDLGRTTSINSVGKTASVNNISRIASVNNRKNIARIANTTSGKATDSYASVMQKAVDSQNSVATPSFATAGDIIIQEAFKKMENDPEWEESVMGKVRDYYKGDYSVDSTRQSYLNLTGQSSLQNYLIQSLIGGQSSLDLGMTGYGYSSYGNSNLAASAYVNVMNNTLNSSLFGNWQL